MRVIHLCCVGQLQLMFTIKCGKCNQITHFKLKFVILFFYCNLNAQLIETTDLSGILRLLFVGSSIISWLFIFCELGNQVTQRYDVLGDSIYDISWYMLPLNTQQYLPMVISIAQNSVYLRGFGSANCTREVFKKVNFTCKFASLTQIYLFI